MIPIDKDIWTEVNDPDAAARLLNGDPAAARPVVVVDREDWKALLEACGLALQDKPRWRGKLRLAVNAVAGRGRYT